MGTGNCAVIVASCLAYAPICTVWHRCREVFWPDCPFPVTTIAPDHDPGWNAGILESIAGHATKYVILFLEDHFLEPTFDHSYTENVNRVIALADSDDSIGLVKLQTGNAWAPEIPFPAWPRLAEYDREPHPFKRTNLVPTLFRTKFLADLCNTILHRPFSCRTIGVRHFGDKGRDGALAFEQLGTELTEDSTRWPERMLGINRADGHKSLLGSIIGDCVRHGKLCIPDAEIAFLKGHGIDILSVPGIERFL